MEEVTSLLLNIDPTKVVGPDGISGRMLKATAYSIAPSVTRLFNLSLNMTTFPNNWKTSSIVPIPKGGTKMT